MERIASSLPVVIGAVLAVWLAEAVPADTGKALFEKYCAACHQSGGNIINPRKTLFNKDLAANTVTTPDAIVRIMRNPGPGMTRFDYKTIPDKNAKAIAEYILKAFK